MNFTEAVSITIDEDYTLTTKNEKGESGLAVMFDILDGLCEGKTIHEFPRYQPDEIVTMLGVLWVDAQRKVLTD